MAPGQLDPMDLANVVHNMEQQQRRASAPQATSAPAPSIPAPAQAPIVAANTNVLVTDAGSTMETSTQDSTIGELESDNLTPSQPISLCQSPDLGASRDLINAFSQDDVPAEKESSDAAAVSEVKQALRIAVSLYGKLGNNQKTLVRHDPDVQKQLGQMVFGPESTGLGQGASQKRKYGAPGSTRTDNDSEETTDVRTKARSRQASSRGGLGTSEKMTLQDSKPDSRGNSLTVEEFCKICDWRDLDDLDDPDNNRTPDPNRVSIIYTAHAFCSKLLQSDFSGKVQRLAEQVNEVKREMAGATCC